MKELLLVVVMAVIFIIGYYTMERIDRFLWRSRRERLEAPVRKRDLLTGHRVGAEYPRRFLGGARIYVNGNATHRDVRLIRTAYSGKSIKKVIL